MVAVVLDVPSSLCVIVVTIVVVVVWMWMSASCSPLMLTCLSSLGLSSSSCLCSVDVVVVAAVVAVVLLVNGVIVNVVVALRVGNLYFMALYGCTSGGNIRNVFACRGDAGMQRQSHTLQWNQYLARQDDAQANFAEVGIMAKLAEGG